MMPRKSIPEGTRFGHLEVIGVGAPIVRRDSSGTRSTSIVKCELCGQIKEIANNELLKGRYRSCGCVPHNYRHGGRYTKLYGIWCGMNRRCSGHSKNPRDKSYAGINVCKEWAINFCAFRDWAVSNGYKEGLSIDRIDSKANYCPSNCRWIPMSEQSSNRRSNSKITAFGKTMTYAEWGRAKGICPKRLRNRIIKGMSPEMAITKGNN